MRLTRAFAVLVVVLVSGASSATVAGASEFDGRILYVTTGDGVLHAYQEGTWTEVDSWQMPFTGDIRGADADVSGRFFYVAYGGSGGSNGTGSLLKWNLLTDSAEWNRSYSFGVDQFAYCGGRIYMPVGEAAIGSNVWRIIDAATGNVIGSQAGGKRPHNTICHRGNVYMGGRGARYLFTTGTTARKIGPSPAVATGIRPFTVNAADTRTWLTYTKFRGFSVASLTTGQILATVNFGPVPSTFKLTSPSHGISLAPDGSEVYVLDAPMQRVQVYSASDVPQFLATVPLVHPLVGNHQPCFYDCQRAGWVLHSGDGRYVFVGESGDVIDTVSRSVVATLPALTHDRHGFLEIDWDGGVPVSTTGRFGVGR